MEFVEIKTGRPFWYNFRDNLTTYHHPCDLIKVRRAAARL